MEEELFFEINESGSFLRLFPGKSQSHGFIKTRIEIKAGVFSGKYEADFMSGDFDLLKQGFLKLYDNLNGSFDFDTLEHDLRLKIEGDGIGHFVMIVSAYDYQRFPDENVLSFELNFDQTYIKDYINQLDKIIKEYT